MTSGGTEMSYGLILLARSGETDGKARYSTFIVPKGLPGYTMSEPYHKVGWKAADDRTHIFDNVRIPRENLLGEEGAGFRYVMQALDVGRVSVAALGLGLAQGCLELALAYALERQTFGKPLAGHQAIQFKLAEMATQIEMARLLTYQAAWLRDEGRPYSKEAAMAKLATSEIAVRAAEEAVQIHGGNGYIREYPVSRFYLDSKVLTIAEGASEMQKMVIARHLGCPR